MVAARNSQLSVWAVTIDNYRNSDYEVNVYYGDNRSLNLLYAKILGPITLNESPADPEHSLLEEVFKGVLDFCYEKDKMEKARSTRALKSILGL